MDESLGRDVEVFWDKFIVLAIVGRGFLIFVREESIFFLKRWFNWFLRWNLFFKFVIF